MNWQLLLASMLSGASQGAGAALQSQQGATVQWGNVGIVAAFGALQGLITALAPHPAVQAAQLPVQHIPVPSVPGPQQ
jgi:hypothetical protein